MSNTISSDLDLMIGYRERLDALEEAKAGDDPDQLRAAKDDLRAFRQEWRAVRESFTASDPSTATPDTVGLKAKGN